MRVYHFLSARNALDDLKRRQIKLSKIDELNDPFELWCSAQEDKATRAALRRSKNEMAQFYGVLCFSRRWHNPVLWSHYADSHRGICLGFEVDDRFFKRVSYVNKRTPLHLPLTEKKVKQILFSKYRDWSYEEEFRGWCRLEERDPSSGHYFYSFDEKVQLREVIAGPLCDTTRGTIVAALGGYEGHIHPIKTRLAFRTFHVVEDRRGFRQ